MNVFEYFLSKKIYFKKLITTFAPSNLIINIQKEVDNV